MNTSLPDDRIRGAESELETLLTEHEYARLIKRSVASVRRAALAELVAYDQELGI